MWLILNEILYLCDLKHQFFKQIIEPSIDDSISGIDYQTFGSSNTKDDSLPAFFRTKYDESSIDISSYVSNHQDPKQPSNLISLSELEKSFDRGSFFTSSTETNTQPVILSASEAFNIPPVTNLFQFIYLFIFKYKNILMLYYFILLYTTLYYLA